MAAKPGERKLADLQTVAAMLEQPRARRSPRGAGGRLELSEAALYRLCKQGADVRSLIEFIEQTVFGLINKITQEEKSGLQQVMRSCRCCSASRRRTAA